MTKGFAEHPGYGENPGNYDLLGVKQKAHPNPEDWIAGRYAEMILLRCRDSIGDTFGIDVVTCESVGRGTASIYGAAMKRVGSFDFGFAGKTDAEAIEYIADIVKQANVKRMKLCGHDACSLADIIHREKERTKQQAASPASGKGSITLDDFLFDLGSGHATNDDFKALPWGCNITSQIIDYTARRLQFRVDGWPTTVNWENAAAMLPKFLVNPTDPHEGNPSPVGFFSAGPGDEIKHAVSRALTVPERKDNPVAKGLKQAIGEPVTNTLDEVVSLDVEMHRNQGDIGDVETTMFVLDVKGKSQSTRYILTMIDINTLLKKELPSGDLGNIAARYWNFTSKAAAWAHSGPFAYIVGDVHVREEHEIKSYRFSAVKQQWVAVTGHITQYMGVDLAVSPDVSANQIIAFNHEGSDWVTWREPNMIDEMEGDEDNAFLDRVAQRANGEETVTLTGGAAHRLLALANQSSEPVRTPRGDEIDVLDLRKRANQGQLEGFKDVSINALDLHKLLDIVDAWRRDEIDRSKPVTFPDAAMNSLREAYELAKVSTAQNTCITADLLGEILDDLRRHLPDDGG